MPVGTPEDTHPGSVEGPSLSDPPSALLSLSSTPNPTKSCSLPGLLLVRHVHELEHTAHNAQVD